MDLRKEFKKETGNKTATRPITDFVYVRWLEKRCNRLQEQIESIRDIARVKSP